MKKKLLVTFLSLAMALTMGNACVYAAEASGSAEYTDPSGGQTTVDEFYTVTKDAGKDDGTKSYYVKVEWERTDGFAKSEGDTYHWDATNKKYVRNEDGTNDSLTSNTPATAKFTITNQSNAKVNYWIEYATATGYDTTETETSSIGKSGTLDSYIPSSESIENSNEEVAANNAKGEGKAPDVSADTGKASYTHEHIVPTKVYTGQVKLNKQASAITNTVVGTYTIKIGAAGGGSQTVEATVDDRKDTVLSSTNNPADTAAGTTVIFPKDIAALADGSTAKLTVEATPVLEAVGDSRFTVVSADNLALGAIDLTLKVNGAQVSEFKNSEGQAVPVIVTTYVAKNIEGFGFNYNSQKFEVVDNESDVDAANEVWYDKNTGKLVCATTHFSTYVIEGRNNAYCKDTNTACDLETAIKKDVDNGQTLLLLKDCILSAEQIKTPKSFTLDLGGKNLTVEKCLCFGRDSSYKTHEVEETIKNGTITFSSNSAYLRFENGSKGTFEDVKFIRNGDTAASKILQTYATNEAGSDTTENVYTFNNCRFQNATLSFEGSSGSCNNYNVSFDKCDFKADNMTNGAAIILIDDYDYGNLEVKNTKFNIKNTEIGGYCVNIDTYLDYTNGQKFNATFDGVEMQTAGNSMPYTYRFLSYGGSYSDNADITEKGTNTYMHNGKTVQKFIKETSATNKSVMWTENPGAYNACLTEWVNYAKASPARADYNSSSYYLVECNGFYYIGGQGQQFNDNATVTKDGNTITQVVVSGYFTSTYKNIGTTDISTQLGESDNTNVKIYTLSK